MVLSAKDGDVPSTQQPYVFEPLTGPNNIRVVELLQCDKDGRLECSLRQVSFTDGGYQALSYVWGTAGSVSNIQVRSPTGDALGCLNVTANLQNALHDLWSAEDIHSKIFWIDQICINQQGEEKNAQVALIRQIYSHAMRVITYLGPAHSSINHDTCCELLNEIHDWLSRNHDRYFKMQRLETISANVGYLSAMELTPDIKRKMTSEIVRWLQQLALGEWYTRLWIVQEQLLNRDMIMLFGNQTLPWDAVVLLPVHFHLGIIQSSHDDQVPAEEEQFEHAPRLLDMWHQRRRRFHRPGADSTDSQLPTLLYNIKAHHSLRSRDIRDHVYALLAVSSDAEQLGLKPEYSKDYHLSHLRMELTLRVLQHDQNLLALQYVNSWRQSDETNKPSWAADIVQCDNSPRDTLRWNNSKAHPRRGFSADPVYNPEEQTLTIKGQIIDEIDLMITGFPSYESDHSRSGERYIATALEHMCKVARLLVVLGSKLDTAALICRVLVGEARALSGHIKNGDIFENQAFHLWSWLHSQIACITEDIKTRLDKRPDSWMLTQAYADFQKSIPHFSTNYSPGHIQEAGHRFSSGMNVGGRSVCRTARNRLSNVPDLARKGDVIASFEGGNLLYVLRRAGDRHEFIGAAYVEGLMNGEAYQGAEVDKLDYDIVLI